MLGSLASAAIDILLPNSALKQTWASLTLNWDSLTLVRWAFVRSELSSVSMLKWLKRKVEGERCDFCLRSIDHVTHLIAGREAMICDECAFAVLVNLDNVGVYAMRALQEVLAVRGAELDPSQRDGLGRALAILTEGGLPAYNVVDAFVGYGDPAIVHHLLDGTRRDLWRPRDWINFTWAGCEIGDFRSVAELDHVLPQHFFDDEDDKHLLRMNIIWARCHADPVPSRVTLQRFVEELRFARDHWTKRRTDVLYEALADKYLSSTHGTLAKCCSALGDLNAAIECLEAAGATSAGVRPLAALLWGDLLAACGDEVAAKAKWRLAAAASNPGPYLAREVATRLPNTPYRGAR